jgi:hypothetical protein
VPVSRPRNPKRDGATGHGGDAPAASALQPAQERARWLLLVHQIPPRPAYFRVKIWRQLQRLGAVAIKNSVYALPRSDAAHESLQWVLQEAVSGGGDASLCEASFLDGLTDEQVEGMFRAARDADYLQLATEARQVLAGLPAPTRKLDEPSRNDADAALTRLQRRLAEVAAIDFFGAPGRDAAEALLAKLERRVRPQAEAASAAGSRLAGIRGGTWVTRKGIHVDRMASAWLIRRFIDPAARFRFVAPKGHVPEPGELRFDMFEAEFTHEGDLCTFEVLVQRAGLTDPALRPLAEIVHDIDLKDQKFGRPETAGIERLVAGIAMAHEGDEDRLQRASAVLDDLYEYFRRKRA